MAGAVKRVSKGRRLSSAGAAIIIVLSTCVSLFCLLFDFWLVAALSGLVLIFGIVQFKRSRNKRWVAEALKRVVLIILGIIIFLILIEIGMRLAGFVISAPQQIINLEKVNESMYRIICYGESTTAGGAESWPSQLEKILNNRSNNLKFKVYNRGMQGTTTALIAAAAENDIKRYDPDLVVSMMGINDKLWPSFRYDKTPATRVKLVLVNTRVFQLFTWIVSSLKERGKQDYEFIPFPNEEVSKEIELHYDNAFRLWEERRFKEAQAEFMKALELRPPESHELSEFTIMQILESLNFTESTRQEILEGSLTLLERYNQINSHTFRGKPELARVYMLLNRSSEAEAFFENYIRRLRETDDEYVVSLLELGRIYGANGKILKERLTYAKIAWALSFEDLRYGAIHPFDGEDRESANKGFNMTVSKIIFSFAGLSPFEVGEKEMEDTTSSNYQLLADLLAEKEIPYIAMQYPTLDVEEIRDRLDNRSDVVYVSNKENFEAALEYNPYEYYFTDIFGGTFGHTTVEGHRLIAENIAEVILEKLNISSER